ncbi:helix-turn-helix domain-containing protein [Fructobacillus sp. M2-14]|uniref:Helix-turn-helix domain-containing protein n=1 Tax=Fructobacillus broussonetiae TaxID=2713173 RepID=A0ABS5QZ84_9LACO|nr:helix-turn-helix domain-containing protein [Fructobacillus broussonetiae]MBS9338508.1 helix-turn-helix domain-containing protein [Fructobacillus broussonetiae]
MDKTNVAKLRKEKGWTQEELAEKSYLTVRTIQRMEAGSDVSLSTLSSVAQALSVSLSDLFEQIEEESKEIQIMEMSQDQTRQINRRRSEKNVILLIIVAFDVVLLSLLGMGGHHLPESQQELAGIVWDGLLFLVIALSVYLSRIVFANHLDKKYPLSVGYKKEHHHEPVQNGWDFLGRYWWIIFPIGGFAFGLWSAMH